MKLSDRMKKMAGREGEGEAWGAHHDEAGGGRPERAERSAAVASAAVTAWEGEELVAEDLVVLAVRPTAKARRRGSAAGQRAGPRRGQQEGRHCVGGWAAIASWGYGGGG